MTEDQISEERAALARLTPDALVGRVGEVMQRIKGLIRDGHVTRAAIRGGKDSTVTLNITLMAALECQHVGIEVSAIYVTSSDTEVESPAVAKLLERQQLAHQCLGRVPRAERAHPLDPPAARTGLVGTDSLRAQAAELLRHPEDRRLQRVDEGSAPVGAIS